MLNIWSIRLQKPRASVSFNNIVLIRPKENIEGKEWDSNVSGTRQLILKSHMSTNILCECTNSSRHSTTRSKPFNKLTQARPLEAHILFHIYTTFLHLDHFQNAPTEWYYTVIFVKHWNAHCLRVHKVFHHTD